MPASHQHNRVRKSPDEAIGVGRRPRFAGPLGSHLGKRSSIGRSVGKFALALVVMASSLAASPNAAPAQADEISAYMLDNGRIRFGGGGQNSQTYNTVNSFVPSGMPAQPFYRSTTGNWFKLTFSAAQLSMTVGSGTGTNWTGSTVATGSHPSGDDAVDPDHAFDSGRHGLRHLTDLTITAPDWTETRRVGTMSAGYGTIEVTGTVEVNGQTLRIRHRYELGATSSFVRIATEITNLDDAVMQNVHLWVGTRDDWVGTSDVPTKTRGNIVDGEFTAITNTADPSSALRITSGAEGVLFYSTTPGTNTVHASCCNFSNSYIRDPAVTPIQTQGDGSYAMYLPVGDLAPDASREIVWFYAAGALADLDKVVRDVADAAAPERPTTEIGNGAVTLTWDEPEVSGGTITGYEVRWSTNDGQDWIASATTNTAAPTYTVTGLGNGESYVFQVRALLTDGDLVSEGDWSPSTLAVIPGLPTNQLPPTIAGDAVVGATLSVVDNVNNWTNNDASAMTVAYQWFADGVPIDGATNPTFTVTPEQSGKPITVKVTRQNAVGSTTAEPDEAANVKVFASLSGLQVSHGTLAPTFDENTTRYDLTVDAAQSTLVLTPSMDVDGATLTIGTATASDGEPLTLSIPVGTTVFTLDVEGPDEEAARYVIEVTRPAPPPASSPVRPAPTPEPEPEPEPAPAPAPEPPPSPAPPPPPPPPPAPIVSDEGRLPAPGEGAATINGEPAAVTVVPTTDGGASVEGDGFAIEVVPSGSGSGTGPPSGGTGGSDDEDGQIGPPVADLTFHQGQTAQVRVRGFQPNAPVALWLFSEPTLLGAFDTDDQGELDALTDALPEDTTACLHTLHAQGLLPSGDEVELSLGVWVEADPYPFADIADTSAHRRAVGCLASTGITRGRTDTTYEPSADILRGQLASMLVRWQDLEVADDTLVLPDDIIGTTHEQSIAALLSVGAAQGYPDGTFRPGQPVTRAQFASILVGLLDSDLAHSTQFPDVSGVHAAAVATLADRGTVTGYADGTFRPNDPIRRDEAASMIVREMINLS